MPAIAQFYATDIQSYSAVVRAAFALAQKSFEEKSRAPKLGGVKIPSITHSIMAMKLLERLGIDDPLTLALALLHDVLEDDARYRGEASVKMRDELQNELKRQGIGAEHATAIAAELYGYCTELCNPKDMAEGKRVYQVENIAKAGDRARLVKIADQTASILEDIWFRHERHNPVRVRGFAYKALDVVTRAARHPASGEKEDSYQRQAAALFRVTFDHLLSVLRANPDQEQGLRHQFTLDNALPKALQRAQDTLRAEIADLQKRLEKLGNPSAQRYGEDPIFHPAHKNQEENPDQFPGFGCVCIQLDKNNRVTAYDLVAQSKLDKKNYAASFLKGEIESGSQQSPNVKTQGIELMMGQTLVRRFVISPPLPLEEFIKKTQAASRLAQERLSRGAEGTEAGTTITILDQRMKLGIEEVMARRDQKRGHG